MFEFDCGLRGGLAFLKSAKFVTFLNSVAFDFTLIVGCLIDECEDRLLLNSVAEAA